MHPRLKKHLIYINSFIHAPRSIGTLVPSSPVLCQTMVKAVDWKENSQVAELGAGDGVLTRHILREMPQSSQLSAYEINPLFFDELDSIRDGRLTVCKMSAEVLSQPFDVIFSCLPFLSLPLRISLRILKSIVYVLRATQGSLVLFQYTQRMERVLSRYFVWERKYVVKNLPPAYVYVCKPK